jgi:Transcriptional regulators
MNNIQRYKLSEWEHEVLSRIKNDLLDKRPDMTVRDVAARNYVSPAFIIKLAKKMGFSGYREMLFLLRQESDEIRRRQDCSGYESIKLIVKNYSDEMRDQFVDYFNLCKPNQVSVMGMEYSSIVGTFIGRRIARKGWSSYEGNPHDLATTNPEFPRLFILISASGETQMIIDSIQRAKSLGMKTVGFVRNERSRVASLVDLPIIVQSCIPAGPNIDTFTPMAILAFDLLFDFV